MLFFLLSGKRLQTGFLKLLFLLLNGKGKLGWYHYMIYTISYRKVASCYSICLWLYIIIILAKFTFLGSIFTKPCFQWSSTPISESYTWVFNKKEKAWCVCFLLHVLFSWLIPGYISVKGSFPCKKWSLLLPIKIRWDSLKIQKWLCLIE